MAKSCLQLQPLADALGTWGKQGKDRMILLSKHHCFWQTEGQGFPELAIRHEVSVYLAPSSTI